MTTEEFEKEVEKRLSEAKIQVKPCRHCKKPMVFMMTIEGKYAPMTMALTNHFIDCPGSKYFKKPKPKI